MVHSGSWLGLPDFGITEGIQSIIAPNSALTAQGGSSLSSAGYAYPGTNTANQTQSSGTFIPAAATPYNAEDFSTPTPTPTNTTTSTPPPQTMEDAFNSIYGTSAYQGWDRAAAWADFQAKGGNLGSSGGSSGPSPEDILNQGYDAAFKTLDEQWQGLDTSAAAQNTQAQGTYDTQNATLTNTYNQNANELQAGQTRALTDLGDTMRQQWQQGNTILGTRGASDSSAANQYAYALTKMGSKIRGDISSEYARLNSNLKNTYDTNMQNLGTWLNTQKAAITQWLSEQQNALRGIKGELQRERSQQIYNYAVSALQTAQQQAAQQKSILDQWVANRANSLSELVAGLNANTANMPTNPGFSAIPTATGTTAWNRYGMNYSDEEKKRLGIM